MRFAGNVIWFVLGGAVIALFWLLGALVFAIFIVSLPLSRSAVEMAKMSAWPFGKDVVHIRDLDEEEVNVKTSLTGTIGFIFNLIWLFTFGWVLFLAYLIAGVVNCLTIIGIPFGIQSFKLAGISFWPVGRRVVSIELAKAAREEIAKNQLAKYKKDKSPVNTEN